MAKIIKALTDTQVKQTKPKDKAYKLLDGGGMHLYITKLGAKSWRMNYVRPVSKEHATMTLGLYPDITLAQARNRRAEICALLAQGIDPQQQKFDNEREQLQQSNNTFSAIAEEYVSRKNHIAKSTTANNYRQLKRLNKFIGDVPITDIKPIDVLNACRSAEA